MHAMGFTIVENVQLRLRDWEALALPGGLIKYAGQEGRDCLSVSACDAVSASRTTVDDTSGDLLDLIW